MKRLPIPAKIASALLLLAAACTALLAARQAPSQQTSSPAAPAIQTTTQERVESEPWWPTKTTFPLSSYAGSASCTKCHAEEGSTASAMQHAAAPVADSHFLAAGHRQSVTLAPYTYTLDRDTLSVTHGADTSTNRIGWDLGAGDLAHTFLFQQGSHWYQSQVTWYTHPAKLDTTTGFNTAGDVDLGTALGQKLTGEEARKCFACHTVHATTSAGFNPAHAEPGIGCEGCHGPGLQHVEQQTAEAAKQPYSPAASPFRKAIFNPAALSPGDSIEFCGACHRTALDAQLAAGPRSLGNATVRFQPYRLEQSKCWRATASERLTCTGCHNPHEPLVQSSAKYDKTCLGCHSVIQGSAAPQHVARVATAGSGTSCVSCHMPRVEVSSMHGAFTDHRIRVVDPAQPFVD